MNLHISFQKLCSLVFSFSFMLILSAFTASPEHSESDKNRNHLAQFDRMTDLSGWVLLGQQLFWTSDSGQTWTDISPSLPTNASVEDVQFRDSNTGWVLVTVPNPDGSARFQLSQTNDGGVSWTIRLLSLFKPGEIASYAEKAEMQWFDSQTGWISVKQTSGSNFSMGTLFTTSDGGSSWSRFTLPIADHIYFSDPQTGWAVGGPTNDQLFKTQDSGATWKNGGPEDLPIGIPSIIYPPVTSDGHDVFVMTKEGVENTLAVYTLQRSSNKWAISDVANLNVQSGLIALSVLDAQNFVATIPGTKSIVRRMDGKLDLIENTDGLSAAIVELDMVSLDIGWAKSVESNCTTESLSDAESASVSCSTTTRLLQTTNGGATWQNVDLPIIPTNVDSLDTANLTRNMMLDTVSTGENTNVFVGQGFDRCEIPTLSQMQTWSENSPYRSANLYIGGSSRACNNSALNSSYLFQLYQQGWKFFPTWVGPQAPCTGYLSRISNDVTTAYQQGLTQADLAVERLAALGLTGPPKSGSVVYYDIEHYGTNAACRSAVNAFMNGWVSQIRARGNLAGVYGSTLCNTGLSDFLNITNVPDVIWPARWYHNLGSGFYDPNANVWNLGSCIPNTAWSNHQRIRQYEGDHYETWGNLTLDIDSNVLDGVVAIPYDYPHVSSIVALDSNPTSAPSVNFIVRFSKLVSGVNQADFSLSGSISDSSIMNVTGSGDTYTVTVNAGSGSGTILLGVVDDDSIQDNVGQALGGAGTGNGSFNTGEEYTITEGFHLSGRYLLDANGNNFMMRGINHPHNWYPDETASFADIKAKGANTVRVVLSLGHWWPKNDANDVANVIYLCKINKLVCVLEVHDTTGYGEIDAASLSQAVDYWKEIKSVLDGQEAYVIINLGNEPYGNINATDWVNDTKNAILEMRDAGFQHMLMVDAPDWGQDWEGIMRDNATNVFASDPNSNVVFSIHMYGVYETETAVEEYISAFVNAGLPLVVGEFGPLHTDGDPDEDAIMSIAQSNGIGYLGWSWSGNSPGGEYLDMVVDFDPNQETEWGNRIIHGPNGILETSCEATIYGGNGGNQHTIVGNTGVAGVTLSYVDGTPKTVTSDNNGNYVITVPCKWSGTVTPSRTGFSFVPASRTYTDLTSNQSNQHYLASWVGGITITSDQNVVAVGRPHIGSEVASYDGFASGSLSAYVPMLFKGAFGSYDSALYVQNVHATNTANVTIQYYNETGVLNCTKTDTIAALSSKGYWLPAATCDSGSLPAGWVGGVVVTSNQPIVAVGRPHLGGEVMTYNGFAAGSLSSYIPMLFKGAFGGSYNAAFYIQNVHATNTANLTIKYYNDSGVLNCTKTDTLAPLASKGYWVPSATCDSGSLPDGWVGGVLVTSDQPIVAVGRPHIGTQVTTYNGFARGSGSSYVPMLFKGAFGGSYDSAFYVQNMHASNTASITLKYYDSNGVLNCTKADTIAPLASKGYWVPSATCDSGSLPSGWVGGVVVTADQPIVAVGRPHIGTQVTTYTGFPNGSLSAYVPMLFRDGFGGSYDSALYLQNLHTSNTANLTIKLYDASGNLACTLNDTLSALASKGYWLPALLCPP